MANRSRQDEYAPVRKRAEGTPHTRPSGQSAAARKRAASQYRTGGYPARPVKRRKKRTNPMLVVLYWAIAVAVAFTISFFVRAYGFEIIRVNGDAMYETMMDGDMALVTKFDYRDTTPARGELVAVRAGNGMVLRRVIAMPGETVEIIDGATYIDGREMLENYVGLRDYESYPGMTLPPEQYYVLSDNRTETYDSRDEEISRVTKEDFVGKVRMVVWPLNHLATF